MELNKIIQDLIMEVETIKKSQRETTLEIETLGKISRTIDASISNKIHKVEERISGAEDYIGFSASLLAFTLFSTLTMSMLFPCQSLSLYHQYLYHLPLSHLYLYIYLSSLFHYKFD